MNKITQFLTTVSLICLIMPSVSQGEVVAEYHSKTIDLSEIKTRTEVVEGRSSRGPQDPQLFKSVEAERLKILLRNIIVDQELSSYNVPEPKDTEIDEALSKKVNDVCRNRVFMEAQTIEAQNGDVADILELIDVWQKDADAGEQLYRESFANKITPQYWEKIKKNYSAPDALVMLKNRNAQIDKEETKQQIRGFVIRQVKEEKLKNILKRRGIVQDAHSFEAWISNKMSDATIYLDYAQYVFPAEKN